MIQGAPTAQETRLFKRAGNILKALHAEPRMGFGAALIKRFRSNNRPQTLTLDNEVYQALKLLESRKLITSKIAKHPLRIGGRVRLYRLTFYGTRTVFVLEMIDHVTSFVTPVV